MDEFSIFKHQYFFRRCEEGRRAQRGGLTKQSHQLDDFWMRNFCFFTRLLRRALGPSSQRHLENYYSYYNKNRLSKQEGGFCKI
ncbi:hypothetical protein COT68_02555 [bacterium (Candidatus Torokbacteria) CG09_land_8_20_14_0_10_42_11]|nr:MAG: hypothetical protein COT68_02555 [bacterium (Candidatus Torokbacteria) CG09_land_8_20_14_0_10_42_11]